MNTKEERELYVNMDNVIGPMVAEYGIPTLRFDQLVKLGQCAVHVYDLSSTQRRITFDMLCDHIKMYIQTPFGRRVLEDLATQP